MHILRVHTRDSKLLGWLYFRSQTQPKYSNDKLVILRNKSFADSTSGTAVGQDCTSVTVSNVLVAHAWPMVVFSKSWGSLNIVDTKYISPPSSVFFRREYRVSSRGDTCRPSAFLGASHDNPYTVA